MISPVIEPPADIARLALPTPVRARLQYLLNRQDAGDALSADERREAEGLVERAESLALLGLRAARVAWARPGAAEADLPADLSVAQCVGLMEGMFRSGSALLNATDALYGPSRRQAMCDFQARLRRLGGARPNQR